MPELNSVGGIPRIGFGTYLIPNGEVAAAAFAALELGYRHIDTAERYENERGVGDAVRRAGSDLGLGRREIFITTKVWPGDPQRDMPVKDYDEVIKALDTSLHRLGLDHVDLYLIHSPLGMDKRIEQWRACCDLRQAGKARAIGVSNYARRHLEEIDAAGLPKPDANQIELHPWSQKPELVSYLKTRGIAVIAYSSLLPLATWRSAPGQGSSKTDEMREEGASKASPFRRMAAKYAVTEARLLLRWGLQNGYAVLPKSVHEGRMKENLDLDSFEIDQPDMSVLGRMDRGDGAAWRSGDPCNAD